MLYRLESVVQTSVFAIILPLPAFVHAHPAPLSASEWFHETLFPGRGTTLPEELKCYSLPYGSLGFVSHALTYYTMLCFHFRRRPLWPFSKISHSRLDALICILSMVVTVVLTAFTMASCRNNWQFVLIAFWKLTLSVSLNIAGLSMALHQHRGSPPQSGIIKNSLLEASLYWLGSFIGLIGLFQIVHQTFPHNKAVRIFTGIMIALVCLSCLSIYWYFFNKAYEWTALLSAIPGAYALLIGFAVFYSDWVLAAVDGNWVGTPSGDQKYLYWVYFSAKRLPMVSWWELLETSPFYSII
ncbi:uncharacterized protein BDR25DRAFT_386309 [Lindgomyces ingoldianus]|uniref:Uncharacterized protein n=1 Tax=Lindgomyces ingoldianus TaxID=673940 RepID=A0ACB6Q8Z8_9PLEO|nr:uncharacterized protein BDR25DRAFT_386309 [Lindgomyces ingoldianus]KAF2462636.1 hypothetical protein BDR25DRAFT_386309 [Lindgomyces ingoldianus]